VNQFCAALLIQYAAAYGYHGSGAAVDPPRLETATHFGALDCLSRLLTAWYSTTPDKTLTLKLSVKTPALAITMSMWEIPAAWMVETAFLGSVTFVFSMPTKSRRELCAVGRWLRSWDLGAWGSRTVPMTVWFGMER
jgi:hypothetical protein